MICYPERNTRRVQPARPFPDRYLELTQIGVPDHQMPARLGMSARSLLRQMSRYGFTPSLLLVEIAEDGRRGRR